MYIQNKAEGQNVRILTEAQGNEAESMIREMRREEIPECVQVIRKSFRTVADQFGITEENAPRYVAFATDERRLFWHMEYEHRLMFVDEEDGVICGYYSLLLGNASWGTFPCCRSTGTGASAPPCWSIPWRRPGSRTAR